MIFVVVGSQKFPFERLIREVDRLKAEGIIQDDVFAQIGPSEYLPAHLMWKRFLDKDEFDARIRDCDVLITHAGEGSIMTGLLLRRYVIAVPRYAALGEHVSDHQLEIARALEKQNHIVNVEDIRMLSEAVTSVKERPLKPYVSEQHVIIDMICSFLG